MKALLRKEFTLSLFPLPYCFWLLAGLLLIPNYPYFVTFFYAALGVMFLFQYNRENRDLNYMMTLPITKGQMVKARVVQTAAIELGMLVACLPFMAVRGLYSFLNNQVGFEANLALLGLGAAQLGIFTGTAAASDCPSSLAVWRRRSICWRWRSCSALCPILLGGATAWILQLSSTSFRCWPSAWRSMLCSLCGHCVSASAVLRGLIFNTASPRHPGARLQSENIEKQ